MKWQKKKKTTLRTVRTLSWRRVRFHSKDQQEPAKTSRVVLRRKGAQTFFRSEVMVNWHLSKQGIRWRVSRDHIAGSCWVLIEVSCFFKLTADKVLVSNWIAGSSPAKTRLDAAITSSSKHLYSRRYSCLGGKRFGKNLFFLHFRRF